jgi:LuxR family transcriptional regulator, maltose regulon positive regulatory protein
MAATHPTEFPQLDNLLITKLEIPLMGARIVMRERLIRLLNQTVQRRLTLLTAPTGYGKTTLLVEWLTTLDIHDWRTIWISLDRFDNAPLRLWSYVVSGIKKVYPRFQYNLQQMIQRGYDMHDPTLLNPLLNEIAQIPYQFCLVLDDYQAIQEQSVHSTLEYFIEHQPVNVHLILSSRTTPPIPLLRLRAQRQLVEINAQDLSFTLPEARSFLTKVMELDLDAAQATALFEATEGWIAGLQLAALSVQGRQIMGPLRADLLRENTQILDYLTTEVLNEQNDEIKEFLLKTAILAELCAPLCDFMLGRTNSQDVLGWIEQSNLFTVCLDAKKNWYRYHPLFAEALSVQLKLTYPDLVTGLHSKACDWLLEHHYPEKAVSHALAAGDPEKAAEIVDVCAMQAIIEYDTPSLLQWIGNFDKNLFMRRPKLGICYALATFLEGQPELAEQILQKVEWVLDDAAGHGISFQEEEVLRWEASAIRSVIECMHGDHRQGITKVLGLLANRPHDDDYFDGFIHFALAEAYDFAGEFDAAVEAFDLGCQVAIPHRHLIEYVHARSEAARVRKQQGRLQQAKEAYLDAMDFGRKAALDASILAMPQSGLMDIAVERNDLLTAQSLAGEVKEHLDQLESAVSMAKFFGLICTRLARYYLAIADFEKAQFHYDQALKSLQGVLDPVPLLPQEFISLQIRLYQAQESWRVDENWDIETEVLRSAFVAPGSEVGKIRQARICMVQKNFLQAQEILTEIEPAIRETDHGELLIETRVLLALAYSAQGKSAEAIEWIGAATQAAEPELYMRMFINEGEEMKKLLVLYLAGQGASDGDPDQVRMRRYVRRLVESFGGDRVIDVQQLSGTLPGATNLKSPGDLLSKRELEVLEILISGKSVKEIAADLMISANTAKIHVKNIYRKLGTHSRKVVFERADELGIHKRISGG